MSKKNSSKFAELFESCVRWRITNIKVKQDNGLTTIVFVQTAKIFTASKIGHILMASDVAKTFSFLSVSVFLLRSLPFGKSSPVARSPVAA